MIPSPFKPKGYYTLRAFKFGHFNFLQQALANALRYFPTECHEELAEEFAKECQMGVIPKKNRTWID